MTSLFLSLEVASGLVVQGSDPGGAAGRCLLSDTSGVSAAGRKMAQWEHMQRVTYLLLAGSRTSVLN